jgi:hypothetical protein
VATCPACGIDTGPDGGPCPRCHLSASLFQPVREAAGATGGSDPAYLRTIGELLASVDLSHPAPDVPEPALGLMSRPHRTADLEAATPPPTTRPAAPLSGLLDLPPEPAVPATPPELKHRLEEYFHLGRRLGLDFTDFETRAHSAALVDDVDSLEVLAREMFVHLSSSVAEEYEEALGKRNELAQFLSTASADVELTAVRRAIGVGDLAGAQRRLTHVHEELRRVEEHWEVGRILVAEGDLLSTTIRELGGDPSPAAGPLEEGRRLITDGHRAEGERLLARATVALWTVLEPLLLAELRRFAERMVEQRSAGLDIGPGARELSAVATELRKRNFVGTIVSYRRLRSAVERTAPAGVGGGAAPELLGELAPLRPLN